MCAGAAAARTANSNAKRNYQYRLKVRARKHSAKINRYKLAKSQYRQSIENINDGLARSYSRAQTKLNRMRDKAVRTNQQALMKATSQSMYGKALAAGRSGKSIARMQAMEAGALGRYFAQQSRNLVLAGQDYRAGTKASRRKAMNAQEQAFAKVWLKPGTDPAPPAPAMQNVGTAMFNDILGFASTAVGMGSSIAKWGE